MAAWAVGLGLFLILVATATSHGATGGSGLPTPSPAAPPGGGSSAVANGALMARLAAAPAQRATRYGPGFYGKRTACGQRLSPSTVGVAHRKLPCGTVVTLYRQGRLLTAVVIDRGPFATGVSWDLTAAAAKQLGMRGSGRVHVLVGATR